MVYGVTVDMYAPYGFNVFELRDRYQKPLDYTKPSFLPIFLMAKALVTKKMKKGTTIDEESP